MNNAQLINQTSGKTEYYTPAAIIEAARLTMGTIDLDPASSVIANQTVKATRFFTVIDNGLQQDWFGNVWMNHPFGESNHLWINKLVTEYQSGRVTQACCITWASTAERWYQPLFAYPICFPSPRTCYMLEDTTRKSSPTKGSSVAYLGDRVADFFAHFQSFGAVMQPALTGRRK